MSGKRWWLKVSGEDGSTMTWPDPTDPTSLEWRLRYAPDTITSADHLALAAFVHAYVHLFVLPSRLRNLRVRQVRAALADAPTEGEEK
ncbi:hypothetical protein I5H32_gp088 [Mycobacterium phage EleanorGeorge]|uniref:Uncharacterized protein n=1 Tax=Mycobacterium phage EleanorGeorge TaxID=2301563 RepID=A0A385DPP9_9CAUD|nr:hypothetical protein I5H32_gp088 [Mycobacterium phage EleanorGeorge]AXQ60788.1 hypothetical protein SEA_ELEANORGEORGE_88 [Mycobacterium phage EleanorGeorge]